MPQLWKITAYNQAGKAFHVFNKEKLPLDTDEYRQHTERDSSTDQNKEGAVGTRERRQREKLERRSQILDSARKMFWQNGFSKTTIPQIAEDAELAPGTIYLYFPSKDSLYAELLVEGYDILIKDLQKASSVKGSPIDRTEALIDAFNGFARNCPEYFDIISFVLQREFGSTREGVLSEEQVNKLAKRENVCKDLAARTLGEVIQNTDSEDHKLTVDAFWSMLVGIVFFWRHDSEENYVKVTSRAKELLLRSIARS